MAEMAVLGAEVRTKGVREGAAELQTFVSTATKTESAVTSLNTTAAKATGGIGKMQAETAKASSSLTSITTAAGSSAATIEKLGTASAAASASLGKSAAGAAQMAASLKPLNDNLKLTSNQVLNLTRQGGDMTTMWAMGASPMQIFTSQAAQLYDAIASGPGGLTGGLKAMGGSLLALATPTNLAVAGLVAAGGAAIYFGTQADSSVKSAEEALASYKALLDSLELGYEKAGKAAEEAFNRARPEAAVVARADIFGTRDEIRASLAAETERLVAQTQVLASTKIRTFADLTPDVLAAQERIRELGRRLQEGEITAAKFREEISTMRLDQSVPRSVLEIIDGLRLSSINARDLANALQGVEAAAGAAAEKVGRLRMPGFRDDAGMFGGATDLMHRLNPEGFDALVKGLTSQADALTKPMEKTQKAEDRALDSRRKLVASVEESARALQVEASTMGLTRGEAAAYRVEMDALARLKSLVAESGGVVTEDEIARIRSAAAEVGRLTQAVEDQRKAQQRLKQAQDLASDIAFERSQIMRTDAEAEIAATLRQRDLLGTSTGEYLAQQIRRNNALADFRDLHHSVYQGIREDYESGAKAGEIFGNVAKNIGGRLKDRLFEGLEQTAFNGIASALGLSSGEMSVPREIMGTSAANAMFVRVVDGGGALGALGTLAGGVANDNGAAGALNKLAAGGRADVTGASGDVIDYIRRAASMRGIDPETALRVIRQESSFNINARNLSSREQSYGLMQLNTMGGLGVHALQQGINVRDPSTWRQQVDFGLDVVKKDGWRQWYGARDVGIGRWEGIGNQPLAQSTAKLATAANTFTAGFDKTLQGVNAKTGQVGDTFAGSFGGVLQQLLSTVGGAAGGDTGGILSGIGSLIGIIPGFADGTNFAPGGLAMVGERGPEIVNLPRGSQVIPNHVIPRAGGGQMPPISVSVGGASVTVQGDASEKTLSMIRQELAANNHTQAKLLERTIGTTMESWNRRRG